MQFRIDGNTVHLFEERPYFRDPNRWIEVPVAQFRFTSTTNKWQLYYRDRNTKWHRFAPEDATTDFDRLVAAVNADPTHIFWG